MNKTLGEIIDEKFEQCRDMDAPLADRLQAFAEEVRRVAPEFATAVDGLIHRLIESGAGKSSPKPGEPMPPFLLPDDQGRLVGLDDLLEKGPVAIAFHRGYWCPYCRINIHALACLESEIAPEGRHIVAIMPDKQKFTAGFKAEAQAPFPVLSDPDNGYAISLDLAFWVGDALKKLMTTAGRNPDISQGSENWMLPIPATFVVGTDGIIAARFVDPDYRTRMAIEDMVGALKAAK
jgi:peroxiredoxin